MPEIQTTFLDIQNVRHVKALTPNQRKIIALVSCKLTQASIAKRLGFSRPYVNQVIKKLESINLIKRVDTQKAPKGTRAYNYFYEVSPEALVPGQPFTSCRVHNIRKKFKILYQSGSVAADKRASWSKSWPMRGATWHKFWYEGKYGFPRVTIDVMPKTIVAYVDKGQWIVAKDLDQAKEIAWYALLQAKEKFIEQQERFGTHLEIESVGEPIAKIHMGFLFDERSPIAQENINLPGWWIDKSPEEQLGPHVREVETDQDEEAYPLESGIRQIQRLPETIRASIQDTLPDAMREINQKLEPMGESILRVQAMMQGGITISQQYEQMVNFMTKALDEMAAIRKENADLKAALNKST